MFEFVADYQKSQFSQNPANRGRFITQGLWSISRHPNYFGEAVMWWAIYIIALGTENGWKTFFGPMFIHFLIYYVSGVKLTERYAK